jgi:hypothetical protein
LVTNFFKALKAGCRIVRLLTFEGRSANHCNIQKKFVFQTGRRNFFVKNFSNGSSNRFSGRDDFYRINPKIGNNGVFIPGFIGHTGQLGFLFL